MYRYYFKGLRMRRARLPKWNSWLINATGDGYTEVRRYSRAKLIFILSLRAVKRMLSSCKKIEDIRFPSRINLASISALNEADREFDGMHNETKEVTYKIIYSCHSCVYQSDFRISLCGYFHNISHVIVLAVYWIGCFLRKIMSFHSIYVTIEIERKYYVKNRSILKIPQAVLCKLPISNYLTLQFLWIRTSAPCQVSRQSCFITACKHTSP